MVIKINFCKVILQRLEKKKFRNVTNDIRRTKCHKAQIEKKSKKKV